MKTIGSVYLHPVHGPIYIVSGQYISNGRLSNHWHFRKIKSDGRLGKKDLTDYGGNWPELDVEIEIIVRLNPK